MGLSFSEKIDDSKWRIDEKAVANSKFSSEGKAGEPRVAETTSTIGDELQDRLAEEIDLVARTIRLVSEIMVIDPILRQRYSQVLQEMSHSGERLEQIAQIVQRGCKSSDAEQLATGPLRARLLREKNF